METYNCPHLGIIEDPGSYLSFPSEANHCLKLGSKTPISLEHQAKYCLSNQFSSCSYFADVIDESVNVNNQPYKKSLVPKQYIPFVAFSVLVVILVFGYITGSSYLTRLFASDMELAENSGYFYNSNPEQDLTSLVLTETAVQSYALSNHCPPPDNWIYYFVKPNDDIRRISEENGITIEQLLKVNCLIKIEDILPGSMIFIPTEKGAILTIAESTIPTQTSVPTSFPTVTSSFTPTPVPTNSSTAVPPTRIFVPTQVPTKVTKPTNPPEPPGTNPPRPTQPPPDRP
jgi:LysM repeat protein